MFMTLPNPVFPEIAQLEDLHKSSVIIYCAGDYPFKPLDDTDIPMLYECLRKFDNSKPLDLVLYSSGGHVHSAQRVAQLLRSYATNLTIMVPYKARSAGTLLCLAANRLILSPMSELGPLDAYISSVSENNPNMPNVISSEDIRAFRKIAEVWFGLDAIEYRSQIFSLVSQRMFPPSLGSFFRSELQIRQIAKELLTYQLPDVDQEIRHNIVEHLITAYPSHDYNITRDDLLGLGLNVEFATSDEESWMWNLLRRCHKYMQDLSLHNEAQTIHKTANGLILSGNFAAQHTISWSSRSENAKSAMPTTSAFQWEILTCPDGHSRES
jgi:hypothetical protein